MISTVLKNKFTIAALITCVLIFIVDLLTPAGTGSWILYTIPIIIVIQSEKLISIFVILGFSGVLLLLGALLKPTGSPLLMSSQIRFLAYLSDLLFAFVAVKLVVTRNNLKTEREQLKARTRELAQVNRELESFSYSVSHDLRAPIRSTGAFAAILLEDYAASLDDEGRAYLEKVISGIDKMNTLVDEILTLSKVGREQLKLGTVDLSAMAIKILDALRAENPERKVHVEIAENLNAIADGPLMEIVLTNLLGNAWKYTSKNESGFIAFGLEKQGEEKVFFVRDNGAGFDMDYAHKLFEPFQRLHSEGEFKGTGIGLAIVKRVIEKHGGRIWAEGKKGEGAVFYFTLQ